MEDANQFSHMNKARRCVSTASSSSFLSRRSNPDTLIAHLCKPRSKSMSIAKHSRRILTDATFEVGFSGSLRPVFEECTCIRHNLTSTLTDYRPASRTATRQQLLPEAIFTLGPPYIS